MSIFVRLGLIAALTLSALTVAPAYVPGSFAAKAGCEPNCL